MKKLAHELKKGDKVITTKGLITVLNTGEDQVENEIIVWWDSWDNNPIRLDKYQEVKIPNQLKL